MSPFYYIVAFFVVCFTISAVMALRAVKNAPLMDEPDYAQAWKGRELSLSKRIELRLQIAHEQEESEHHQQMEAARG